MKKRTITIDPLNGRKVPPVLFLSSTVIFLNEKLQINRSFLLGPMESNLYIQIQSLLSCH